MRLIRCKSPYVWTGEQSTGAQGTAVIPRGTHLRRYHLSVCTASIYCPRSRQAKDSAYCLDRFCSRTRGGGFVAGGCQIDRGRRSRRAYRGHERKRVGEQASVEAMPTHPCRCEQEEKREFWDRVPLIRSPILVPPTTAGSDKRMFYVITVASWKLEGVRHVTCGRADDGSLFGPRRLVPREPSLAWLATCGEERGEERASSTSRHSKVLLNLSLFFRTILPSLAM
jgi:hypothetical protein